MSTVVTANAYTPIFSARPVTLSNNWIVGAVKNGTTSIILYISKDGGSTFSQLCYKTVSTSSFSLGSNGTNVWLLYISITSVCIVKFDATTVTNINLTGDVSIADIESVTECSIAVLSATEMTVTWIANPGTIGVYSAKSTDGGATWTKQDGSGSYERLVSYAQHCSVVYGSNGKPIIAFTYQTYTLYTMSWSGSAWGAAVQVYDYANAGLSHVSMLCKKSGSNIGRIFIVGNFYAHGKVYYSDDNGASWTVMTITTDTYPNPIPALAENPSGDIIYIYGISTNIKYQTCPNGTTTFDTEISVTTTATSGGHVVIMDYQVNQMIWYLWGTSTSVLADKFIYNVAPLAPILTAKTAFDASTAATLYWAFNDTNVGDTQSAYQLQIIRVSDGSTIVDSGKVSSVISNYSLAADTLVNATAYQWKVKTWDALDTEGPYSALGAFTTSGAPTVTITYPVIDAAVHPYSAITAAWSVADPQASGQSAYQIELTDMADVVLWDSTKTADINARSKTVDYSLTNGSGYKLKITAWNGSDVSSVKVVRTFTVSYTAPATPTLTAVASNEHIILTTTNPAPAGSEPTVITNDLYRRISGATTWERIKTGIVNSGVYNDYAVTSGVTYEYKVRANGNNDTTADSSTASSSVTLSGVWLHDVVNPAGTIKQFKTDGGGRQTDWQAIASLMQFDGRSFSVAEFGTAETNSVSVTMQMTKASGDLAALETLVYLKTTLCYRDGRGRKIFGVIIGLPVAEERSWGYTVTVRVDRVDYTEVV